MIQNNAYEALINKIIQDKDMSAITSGKLDAQDFIEYESEIGYLIEYYNSAGVTPEAQTFVSQFTSWNYYLPNAPYEELVRSVQERTHAQRLQEIMEKSNNAFNDGDYEAGIHFIEQLKNTTFFAEANDIDLMEADNALKIKNAFFDRGEVISCGIEELDEAIGGGYERGSELVVYFARTGQGKSWMLLKSAESAVSNGCRVAFVSPEMTEAVVLFRYLTLSKGFSYSETVSGLNEKELDEFLKDGIQKTSGKFFVATPQSFKYRITVPKLKAYAESRKLDMLIVDGLKYVYDVRTNKYDNFANALTNVAEDLMTLSKDLKMPILIAVQANRSGALKKDDDGLPELDTIRDSDGIAHNASKVIALRQVDNFLNLQVHKNRSNKSGQTLSLVWDIDNGNIRAKNQKSIKTGTNFESRIVKPSSSGKSATIDLDESEVF